MSKPDYWVKGLHKLTSKKGFLGVAWKKDDGSISIAINPFITVPIDENLVITLFPNDGSRSGQSD
jgi:hypothetical protein